MREDKILSQYRIISGVLLFFGAMNLINIGSEDFGAILEAPGAVKVLALVALGIMLIATVAMLYMGYTGLKYCKGDGKGTLHITIAKICIVVSVLGVVIAAVDLFVNNSDVGNILGSLFQLVIIYYYLKFSKEFIG
ncbi:MAG: hypothetical protein Q4B18_05090 [Bacillota bacterium]|nr:hypothetical protein [Bacillota bacterium]